MAKIPFSFGGGGGDSSDDCTATAADVLENKTAIYNGSEDDAANGSMKDYSGTSTSASVTNNSSSARVELAVPNTGKYDTAAKLYTPYSTLASAVSLTAAKIATGNTIMGVTGTYTGVGTAGASQVLSGYTFSNSSSSGISGTMTDKSGSTSSANSSLDSSNSRVRLQVPSNGYYNTSAYLYASYSNIRSLIGLSASIIKYGETVLGVTGTWNGYVATATDIYYGGSVGSLAGSMSVYSDGMITASAQSACIRIVNAGGENNQCYGGASFSSAINLTGYSKITLTFNMTQTASSSGTTYLRCIGIGLFSSRPTSGSALNLSNAFRYVASTALNSSSTQTISIDVSDISSSYYIGVCGANNVTGSTWTAEITRIQLS